METHCTSLAEVREHIDLIDRQIVALLARRGGLVSQAAAFKRNTDEVRAPARVEQVIARTLAMAAEVGADPRVVEATYRSMIAAFIDTELAEHATLHASADTSTESPEVVCNLIRLKPGSGELARRWAAEMNARKPQVVEALRDEGVHIESAFLLSREDGDYLVYYMRVRDLQRSQQITQQSQREVDAIHKAFQRETWIGGENAELLLDAST